MKILRFFLESAESRRNFASSKETNDKALPSENTQGHNLEVRVKGCANADSQNKQEEDFDFVSFISYVLQNVFGVRV